MSIANTEIKYPAPALKTVLELLKPITWFPPMWAFGCGVVSSGRPLDGRWPLVVAGLLIAGPFVCGTSQAVNDWFDRHVDAINEPNRPIPSGRMPGRWGLYVACLWTALSLIVAMMLGQWGFGAAVVGLALAWAYSAPPFRLKQNGWWGNTAVAVCYEGLPWITGAAVMMGGAAPDSRILVVAMLYAAGAHGIMTLNDFKSVEGDRRMGIRSLPAQLGEESAARLACIAMAFPQIVVVTILFIWGQPAHAATVALLLAIQMVLMRRLLQDPRALAPWYNATGVTILGMLVSAFALRSGIPAPL
ncbi:MAG: chlorophyll synthase ChlG [Gammaproteobacteria bacterium]